MKGKSFAIMPGTHRGLNNEISGISPVRSPPWWDRRARTSASVAFAWPSRAATSGPQLQDHGHHQDRDANRELRDHPGHSPHQPATRMTCFRAVPVPGAEGAPRLERKTRARSASAQPPETSARHSRANHLHHRKPETRTTRSPRLPGGRATSAARTRPPRYGQGSASMAS
jgi:hypothetical protein